MRPSHMALILTTGMVLSFAALYHLVSGSPILSANKTKGEKPMAQRVQKSEDEWKNLLTLKQYRVMRQGGTEAPFSGKYNMFFEDGIYHCASCGTPLFASDTKYDHGCGWPSFTSPIDEKNIEYRDDYSLVMRRTEIRCAACGAHLGHVFDDGPMPARTRYCINSVSLDFHSEDKSTGDQEREKRSAGKPPINEEAAIPEQEVATFAAGCFWGVEDKFSHVKGVLATAVGYTGGQTENPTYQQVCSDRTGHAEAVQVTYDPSQVSYEELLRVFFSIHDPTQLNRQGSDVGTQYRTTIFYHNDKQKVAAQKMIQELEKSGRFGKSIVTQLVPAPKFYRAEEYHQSFYEKNYRRQ
ncbi:MAG: bifunctional methionine sulfoxide reductase B/A protein [Candidatus Aminicenantales bacterium]